MDMKRKYQDDGEDGPVPKRVKTGSDFSCAASKVQCAPSRGPAQNSSWSTKPTSSFPMFELLPTELQIQIFEQALLGADKPRICLLDVTTVPCFARSRLDRGFTMGWALSVNNRSKLDSENPFKLARSLRETCPSGAYVAERFIQSHVVWDPPHYCAELKNLDLSLFSDVFWLPEDLYQFLALRSTPAACLDTGLDEQRIRRLMISLSTFEKVVPWHQGHVQDDEVRDGEILRTDFQVVLETILWNFPGCTELIVLVNADNGSSERPHLSWDKLHYITPTADDQYRRPNPGWNIDRDIDSRCCAIWDQFYELLLDEELERPDLSFAFL